MKKKIRILIIALLFLGGFALMAYPFAANQWNTYRQKQLTETYYETIASEETAGAIDYEAEWNRAKAYNDHLIPSILPDSFAKAAGRGEPEEEYMACLNLAGDGMMGTIEIPRIGIQLPVYHTTSQEVLEKAAGHLEGSSLPIGGEGTHAVLSAHRGLPSASLFTDLDQLEMGDHFMIHVLDESLCYEVDQILVVEPEDTSALEVEEGKDLVTLLTCTPYGVNSHRLLVRGHRVPYDPAVAEEESPGLMGPSIHTNYVLWLAAGMAVTGGLIFLMYRRDRKRGKRNEGRKR